VPQPGSRRARAPARQAEQPGEAPLRRAQEPPQRGPREERAAEGRVDAGADADPDDEEDGERGHVARVVGLPRAPDERVDEEARAADAHRVGDGQPEQADEAIHGCSTCSCTHHEDAEAQLH